MSDDSMSDTGDINEGEGAKVVQSSFREPSIITKSIVNHDFSLKKQGSTSSPLKQNAAVPSDFQKPENKPKKQPENKPEKSEQKPTLPAPEKSSLPQEPHIKLSKKNYKKITEDLCFEVPRLQCIPIVNKDTTHPDRFDLDFLLDPKVQKVALSGHRLTQSTTFAAPGSFVSPKNFVKKNIKSTKSHSNSLSQKASLASSLKLSTHSKRPNLDVDERFYKKAQKTEAKIKALKEVKEMEEINGCTFNPKIRSKRKNKTYEEFYSYMMNFAEKKEKKVKCMQEEDQKAYEKSIDFSHQPKLCENSMKLAAKKLAIEDSTFDRLHKYYKYSHKSPNDSEKDSASTERHQEAQRFFHPTVNKRSQDLQRSEPIETILYNDAIRRREKSNEPKVPATVKFINHNSEKFLIDKLKRDFEESFSLVDIDCCGEINYTRMIELFKVMRMLQDNGRQEEERLLLLECWKSLTHDESQSCTKELTLALVLAIMGFSEDWMTASALGLSPNDVKKMHKKFELFYSNRASALNKSAARASKDSFECSFSPHIGLFTDRLADSFKVQNRSHCKLEDALIAEKEKVKAKVDELRKQLEEKKMEECSFNPMIEQMPEAFKTYSSTEDKEDLASEYFKLLNATDSQSQHKGVFLYNLAKIYKDKKEAIVKDGKEKEIQQVLKHCTFAPHLEKRIFQEEEDFLKPEPKVLETIAEVKSEPKAKEKKQEKGEKSKESIKPKASEEKQEIDLSFFHIVSNNSGVAKISVKTPSSKETLQFNIKTDDPASVVMAFSKKFSLSKEDEYKLVKKLTLLKYKSD